MSIVPSRSRARRVAWLAAWAAAGCARGGAPAVGDEVVVAGQDCTVFHEPGAKRPGFFLLSGHLARLLAPPREGRQEIAVTSHLGGWAGGCAFARPRVPVAAAARAAAALYPGEPARRDACAPDLMRLVADVDGEPGEELVAYVNGAYPCADRVAVLERGARPVVRAHLRVVDEAVLEVRTTHVPAGAPLLRVEIAWNRPPAWSGTDIRLYRLAGDRLVQVADLPLRRIDAQGNPVRYERATLTERRGAIHRRVERWSVDRDTAREVARDVYEDTFRWDGARFAGSAPSAKAR